MKHIMKGGRMTVEKLKRDDVILALHQAQEQNKSNYLSEENIKTIAEQFQLSLADISGILTFYSLFSPDKRGKHVIRVCDSLPCRVSGSVDIYLYLQEKLGIKNKETTKDNLFTLEVVNCLGACDKAPNVMINDEIYSEMTPEKIDSVLDALKKEVVNAE